MRGIWIRLTPLLFAVSAASVFADEAFLENVLLTDVDNLVVGKYHQKEHMALFAIPKDQPATSRGMIWGEMYINEFQGKKYASLEFFDCGPVTSHVTPVEISFSDDDEYLVVESGGEGGTFIDVFDVDDLFASPPGRGWNGTEDCIAPLSTVGGYLVPVAVYGWDGQVPLIQSTLPLDQVSSSEDVRKYEEQQESWSDAAPRVYAWDVLNSQFIDVESRGQ